ncbi:MAG: hypothetical protein H6962_13465 [Chromatiaceae bacterium]|nr:hypothetical protein [Chromatiaceae bacterium]
MLVDGLATAAGWGTALSGVVALYFMHRIYRIPARPYWDHWQVLTSFYGSMLALGGLLAGLATAVLAVLAGTGFAPTLGALALPVCAGLLLESFGLWRHARDLPRAGGEGSAGHYLQSTDFGKTYVARNISLGVLPPVIAGLALSGIEGLPGLVLWGTVTVLAIAAALAGRAIFYAVVVPTTMPGAFFWKNAGFQQHARETGLAEMPQVGVLADAH